MNAIQHYRVPKGGQETPFTPLVDSSYASFGTIRLYDESALDSIRLVNDVSLAEADIPWDGEKPNLSAISSHLGANGGLVKTLYDQKTSLGSGLLGDNPTQSTWPVLNLNDIGIDKPSSNINNAPTNYLAVNGLNRSVLFGNCSYSVIVMAVKIEPIVRANPQILFYYSTRTFGRPWVRIDINADPSTGGIIYGRRINNDSIWSASFSFDFTNGYNVITGIWDFVRRELVIRVNGVELANNTTFSNGTRSENSNGGNMYIGRYDTEIFPCINNFAGITFFRSDVDAEAPPISEIQAVENRYMTYLGI